MGSQKKPYQFDFIVNEGETLTVEDAVYQALGAASTCWERIEEAGVFKAGNAWEIGKKLVGFIEHKIADRADKAKGPYLGMATTDELLDEIRARIATDYASGGGGLHYTTTKGRPEIQDPK